MAEQAAPYGRVTQKKPAVAEIHILWITAGLGCDGDSVSITAATQPSVEDVLLGAIPGLPTVHLHNPVLAYENGDDFLKYWYQAEQGKLEPFVLVVEGSIPNEKIKKEGYWAGLGTNPQHRPTDHHQRVDRSPDSKGAGCRCLRHLCHLWRHSRHGGQPHRLHGTGRLSGLGLEVQGWTSHRECSWLPGAAGQFHGNGSIPPVSSCRPCSDDPAG